MVGTCWFESEGTSTNMGQVHLGCWGKRPNVFVGEVQLFGRDVVLFFLKQLTSGGVSNCFTKGTLPVLLCHSEEVAREVVKDFSVSVVAHLISGFLSFGFSCVPAHW
jgi:hypothetical protein